MENILVQNGTMAAQNNFWYIDKNGQCKQAAGKDEQANQTHYIFENHFSTEEEANDAAMSWQTLMELKKLAADSSGSSAKRDLSQHKWHLVYILRANKVIVTPLVNSRTNALDVFFNSEEEGKNAIKQIGEQRLKKYFFNVPV